MHLLAAQPGGFVDDEGIIDLEQSPADIIILAAADSLLAGLANTADQLPDSYPSIRLANWLQLQKPAAFDLYQSNTLEQAKVVIVSMLGGSSYWEYGFQQLQEWQQQKPERKLVLVAGDDSCDQQLTDASSIDAVQVNQIWQYLRQGNHTNLLSFYGFIADQLISIAPQDDQHTDFVWQPPQQLPNCLLYMPSSHYQHQQASLDEWQKRWLENAHVNQENSSSVCAVIFYRSHLQSANTAMFDRLIATLEANQLQPLPIALTSLKDPEALAKTNDLLRRANTKVVVNTTGFAANRHGGANLSSEPSQFLSPFDLDIPVCQLLLSSSTEEDWQQFSQGLRSRDIAMQVVLPEMDGRIITRAISFKAEACWSERCQISVVGYELQQERAQFVSQLIWGYIRLANKENHQKRLALILANYPTKDGRIGNGVGLDTPASTINILRSLANTGYPVANIPSDGNALVEQLQQSVTNNLSTIQQLPCWQSLSLDDYYQCFNQLPDVCQSAVLERWGSPEQDPKYRQGRLMLAGIRLGETFVGIQPARGFNVDLNANYHDPDLVPPHSYLAFYFWLRQQYQVDAVIHIGKHGNLEWLPGKGNALSATCWPEVALGPMPNFYPFIVNDPGEGAQAKRRSQAVIIDHLMPPLARAEIYGPLAELETLVDEYYQAMSMDSRRQQWLRERIVELIKRENIWQELPSRGLSRSSVDHVLETAELDDDVLLEQLDAYLCDIKEAQIRHGLHRLGELPDPQKLASTLVALLRLPRGNAIPERGILHNLATDLGLNSVPDNTQTAFDPLQSTPHLWLGLQPEQLDSLHWLSTQLDDFDTPARWRTTADVRECLEDVSLALVKFVLISNTDAYPNTGVSAKAKLSLSDLNPYFPATSQQLKYAANTLLPALQRSAEGELASLCAGLEGHFVEPGPSGAPSRGRLDVLPTGRNFFAVDNRAIPSTAAWALGEKSAQALIERHLQEHGDYPRQLGLSVWGTATMRTGGDDIAQAFALMGVKPIWAAGSQRVIDFEIIPSQLLRRPRVDVTLRVSGFFRDAFANVMRLFDAAVRALAEYQEPGGLNTVRANIEQRQQQLIEDGISSEQAQRQASYRVFGSKPGAYGAGLQGLIDERNWQQRSDLAEAYLNWGGYAYGQDDESRDGIVARQSFQHRLSQLEAVVQNQDNREHDILDSDDYYQFQGGMSNAVETFSGQQPTVYHSDHSNPVQPKIRTLKEELNRVVRSRLVNPKWITAMREHGYKGAFEMAASVDYLFAYDATTNLVDDYQYQQVTDTLVFDQQNRQFMQQNNPAALEEMAERLLEACQRGLWQQPGSYQQQLQDLLLELDEAQEQRH